MIQLRIPQKKNCHTLMPNRFRTYRKPAAAMKQKGIPAKQTMIRRMIGDTGSISAAKTQPTTTNGWMM